MTAGRTEAGRRRAKARRKQQQRQGTTQLLRGQDHGSAVVVEAEDVGELSTSPRWADAFIEANGAAFQRLDLRVAVASGSEGVTVRLQPRATLGAVPLLAPSTRRVHAGLLVEPRFGWSRVGSLLADVDFAASPRVGGLPMVPGSAREVPPWILAGPVLSRVQALLGQLSRSFVQHSGLRATPRGTVDWGEYGRCGLPTGRWGEFQCTWPELEDDVWLTSSLRWTMARIRADLERMQDSTVARALIQVTRDIDRRLGPGPSLRPDPRDLERRAGFGLGEVLKDALEGVAWISEERGLGGALVLDGIPWSLGADVLWEAWVESVAGELSRRLGGRLQRRDTTRRRLRWEGRIQSLGSLEPDVGIAFPERMVWLDAKYKFHFHQMRWRAWADLSTSTRESHRADVHQALAYASLTDAESVDTALIYPLPGDEAAPSVSVAHVPAGRRKVRLLLAGLPFGYRSEAERERAVGVLESVLRGAA